jgi:hypothetical protein
MESISHGPLVLCLHGFPDTAGSFVPVLKSLADAGYRAVAPFMRGYPRHRLGEQHRRKRGFSQINVTTRRRPSSTGASREPQTLSRELRAMGYRKFSARPRHHARAEGAIEDFKNVWPAPSASDFVAYAFFSPPQRIRPFPRQA